MPVVAIVFSHRRFPYVRRSAELAISLGNGGEILLISVISLTTDVQVVDVRSIACADFSGSMAKGSQCLMM